jgi:hypothetical protein
MGNNIKTAATNGTVVSLFFDPMYSNNAFSNTALNTTGKQLKDKTAASKDYFSIIPWWRNNY